MTRAKGMIHAIGLVCEGHRMPCAPSEAIPGKLCLVNVLLHWRLLEAVPTCSLQSLTKRKRKQASRARHDLTIVLLRRFRSKFASCHPKFHVCVCVFVTHAQKSMQHQGSCTVPPAAWSAAASCK